MEFSSAQLKTLWNEWELRGLVLFSLLLQIVLVITARWRKKMRSEFVMAMIWGAYLLSDFVATYSLGLLSKTQDKVNKGHSAAGVASPTPSAEGVDANMQLVPLWAPFLLLHLGGPDSITAFSLEDNQLWLRHALGLVIQVVITIYILVRYYPLGQDLWVPYVMVFLAGLFKYGERTYALWRGSMAGLRKSTVGDPDPGPGFAELMSGNRRRSPGFAANMNTRAIWIGRELFEKFRVLFVESIFSYRDRVEVRNYFLRIEHDEAFRAVEMELSFAYDVLFTKASVSRCFRGFLLRTLGLLLTSMSLRFFSGKKIKSEFNASDVVVTQILLVGAVVLDMASLVSLLFSSWTIVLLRPGGRHPRWEWFGKLVVRCYPKERPKWSNRVSQYSMLTSCVRDLRPTMIQRSMTAIGLKNLWDHYHYTNHNTVEDSLKEFIFRDLKAKSPRFEQPELFTLLGEWVLTLAGSLPENLQAAEFDESILVWHIATELSYHSDADGISSSTAAGGQRIIRGELRITRQLSNYMLYLLVVRPHMLSSVALMGEKRYEDTCADLKRLILQFSGELDWNERDVSRRILSLDTYVTTPDNISKSVLRDAWSLARKLQGSERRWQILCRVWVEMLCYAAVHCMGYHHAAQLSQGGELLTFIWLLMAHLGVVEHYRGLRWVKPL